MSFFKTLDISASALTAQSMRMDVIAQNVANANTTRTPEGTPYRRKTVVLEENKTGFNNVLAGELSDNVKSNGGGVKVSRIVSDTTPFNIVHDPSHPDADEQGYVQLPNIDITREYVDMISASRSYEANITVMNTTKRMALKTFEIGK